MQSTSSVGSFSKSGLVNKRESKIIKDRFKGSDETKILQDGFEKRIVKEILNQYRFQSEIYIKIISPSKTTPLSIDLDEQSFMPIIIRLIREKEKIDELLLSNHNIIKLLEMHVDPFIDECNRAINVLIKQLNQYSSDILDEFQNLNLETDNLLSRLMITILTDNYQKTLKSPGDENLEIYTISFALDLRLFQIQSISNFLKPIDINKVYYSKKNKINRFKLKERVKRLNDVTTDYNATLKKVIEGTAETYKDYLDTIVMNSNNMPLIQNLKLDEKKIKLDGLRHKLYGNNCIRVCSNSINQLEYMFDIIASYFDSLADINLESSEKENFVVLTFNSNKERLKSILETMNITLNKNKKKRTRSGANQYTCDIQIRDLISVYNQLNKY